MPIFLETYRLVDQPTKMRMEELLATWKESGPGGRPLFNENAQWNIERSLFGSQGMPPSLHRPVQQVHPLGAMPPRSPNPTIAHPLASTDRGKAKAIESIDRLLALDSQRIKREPNNTAVTERMDSLRQLKQVLQVADLSPEEMEQVHAQLDSLTASSQASKPQQPIATAPSPPPNAPTAPAAMRAGRVASPAPAQPASSAVPASITSALANLGNLGNLANLTADIGSNTVSHQPIPTAQAPVAAAANGGSDAASALIASLMQAGLLPGAGAQSVSPLATAATAMDQDEEYVKAILALDIKTSGPEFSKEPPAIELLLHKHLPLQCRQCANRYPKGDKGQKMMDEHLDWHFTQNRRAKDYAVRGQSRAWFDKLQGFIRGGFDDAAPSSKEAGGGNADESVRPGGLTAAQEKALKEKFAKSFVPVPSDPELSSKPCPICKESFKSQWSEDEEEWIWLNAIEVDGVVSATLIQTNSIQMNANALARASEMQYYHASCHYSAKALSESVIRRGSSPPDGATRASTGLLQRGASRSATPHGQQQRSASVGNPVARLKGEEGIVSVPALAPSPDTPESRKRKASPSSEEDETPSKKTTPAA